MMEELNQSLEKYKNSLQEINTCNDYLKRMIYQQGNNQSLVDCQSHITALQRNCEIYIQTFQQYENIINQLNKPCNKNEYSLTLLTTYYDLNYKYDLLRCMKENLLSSITESNMINQLLFEGNDNDTIWKKIHNSYSGFFYEVKYVYEEFQKKKSNFESQFVSTYSSIFSSNGSLPKFDRITYSLYLALVLKEYQYNNYEFLKVECPPVINTNYERCISEEERKEREMKIKVRERKQERIRQGITLQCPKCTTMNHKDSKFCCLCQQYLETENIYVAGQEKKKPKSTSQLYLYVC